MSEHQKLLKIVFMYYKEMTREHYFEDHQLILSTQTCIQPFVMMG
jgi:hypothetical protein